MLVEAGEQPVHDRVEHALVPGDDALLELDVEVGLVPEDVEEFSDALVP